MKLLRSLYFIIAISKAIMSIKEAKKSKTKMIKMVVVSLSEKNLKNGKRTYLRNIFAGSLVVKMGLVQNSQPLATWKATITFMGLRLQTSILKCYSTRMISLS